MHVLRARAVRSTPGVLPMCGARAPVLAAWVHLRPCRDVRSVHGCVRVTGAVSGAVVQVTG